MGEVAVIGAGPYGLAAATQLRQDGLSVRGFGRPMSFWSENMPLGMLLRSPYVGSSIGPADGPLGLDTFAAERGRAVESPIPLDDFVSYGRWVQERVLPDVDHRSVVRLEAGAGQFRLELEDGTEAFFPRVVVAAGIGNFARVPKVFSSLPASVVSHASMHRDLSLLQHSRVLVVGAGQSALESAALLHETGAAVTLVARAPEVRWLRKHGWSHSLGPVTRLVYAPAEVGPPGLSRLIEAPGLVWWLPSRTRSYLNQRAMRPAGAGWLRDRVDELVPLRLLTTVVRAQRVDDTVLVTYQDGSTADFDHVLLGTGYSVDLARYAFLAPSLVAGIRQVAGYPVLGRAFESSIPGLHFLGAPAAFSYGPLMRFVAGTAFAAHELSGRLTNRRRNMASAAAVGL